MPLLALAKLLGPPVAPATAPEERLVRDCRAGDRRAQEQFYRTHYHHLLGICRRYARDHQQASDLVNRSFQRAFAKLELYRGEGTLRAWLRTLCRNVCLNALASAQPHTEEIAPGELPPLQPAALSHLAVSDIIMLLQQLSPLQRAVFNLIAVDGYSHREAAESLQITEVNSRDEGAGVHGLRSVGQENRSNTGMSICGRGRWCIGRLG